MPVALIAMSVLVMLGATTPSDGFAVLHEQESGFVQINRHGLDRCWDATPNGRRHPQINKVARKIQVLEVEENCDQPNWYDSMSEMLPVGELLQTPWLDRRSDIGPSQQVPHSVSARQVTTPPIIERGPGRKVMLPGVMLVFIVIVLTLSTIEVLFRCTVKGES
jgi:hypothetical protein